MESERLQLYGIAEYLKMRKKPKWAKLIYMVSIQIRMMILIIQILKETLLMRASMLLSGTGNIVVYFSGCSRRPSLSPNSSIILNRINVRIAFRIISLSC